MAVLKPVVIAIAKCTQSRSPFGVRIEMKAPHTWLADWAFALKEKAARKEGYDQTRIEGRLGIDKEFPGCPFCSAQSLVQCDCGRITCLSHNSATVTCPWCGNQGRVSGKARSLGVGKDR